MARSPDIEAFGNKWEIKSPTGGSSRTIENNMRLARGQSKYLVVDLMRIKLHQARALSNIRHYLKRDPKRFKKVLVITKSEKVVEVQ